MERSVAIKKLGKLLGKKLGYRVNDKAPSKEERDAAKAALRPAVDERDRIGKQKRERCEALLAGDAEYQSLRTRYEAASDRAAGMLSVLHHYKITVGTLELGFFRVTAEGDSWEEVIQKVKEKA
jgi:hypothetical protein